MGKTTLYHPISLHVIRGAAEYCGFQFGKLKQLDSNKSQMFARYEATIQQVPPGLDSKSNSLISEHLQKCFMDDIEVIWVHRTKSGVLVCHLWVDLKKGSLDHQDGSNRLRQTGSQ